ncbi:hypothetical protein BDZ90DRAFT_232226 [Jaminaea rosea]|uniref:Uncharacterized protein n=1 Tax=Jaminaea rosea TaxID=1569628 RepID=A0A316US82_9BASI|nr:hypothetical protein BDZ90DRAFT_232226 [Jaminaea rosea]PWN27844.1 hypothetical protein BDZ90DRAFT_232226 [Jaminaea rosea]
MADPPASSRGEDDQQALRSTITSLRSHIAKFRQLKSTSALRSTQAAVLQARVIELESQRGVDRQRIAALQAHMEKLHGQIEVDLRDRDDAEAKKEGELGDLKTRVARLEREWGTMSRESAAGCSTSRTRTSSCDLSLYAAMLPSPTDDKGVEQDQPPNFAKNSRNVEISHEQAPQTTSSSFSPITAPHLLAPLSQAETASDIALTEGASCDCDIVYDDAEACKTPGQRARNHGCHRHSN